MSGYVGVQGRNATSFGYGPKLGVGRYPARERGVQDNALLAAAGPPLFRNPPGVEYSLKEGIPPELLAPIAARGAGAVSPVSDSEGGGNALLAILPALLAAGAPYLLKEARGLFDSAPPAGGGYDQLASDLTANAGMSGVTPTMGVTDPGWLAQNAGNLGNINDLAPPVQSGEFAGVQDWASNPDTTYQQNTSNSAAPVVAGLGMDVPAPVIPYDILAAGPNALVAPPVSGEFTPIGSMPAEPTLNISAADFTPDLGGFGPPDIGGAGLDLGAMDWGVTPGTGAFGLGADIGPVTIDPLGILGGAVGSWGGGRLASSLVQGDEQQGWASNIGGTLGGAGGGLLASALAGSAFGPVGTLVGAFLGALGGGTLAAGEPDYGYGYTGANVGYGDTGPQLNFWAPNAQNSGSTGGIGDLGNALQQYINQQASAGGYTLNPEMINRGAFSAGRTDAPGGKWFVGGLGVSPADAAYGGAASWRGDNFAGLQDQVWQSLVGNNVYTRGPTTPWADVWAQVAQPREIWSGGEAGDFLQGYTDPSQNVFGSPAMLPGQTNYGQVPFDPTMYDQGGAA